MVLQVSSHRTPSQTSPRSKLARLDRLPSEEVHTVFPQIAPHLDSTNQQYHPVTCEPWRICMYTYPTTIIHTTTTLVFLKNLHKQFPSFVSNVFCVKLELQISKSSKISKKRMASAVPTQQFDRSTPPRRTKKRKRLNLDSRFF